MSLHWTGNLRMASVRSADATTTLCGCRGVCDSYSLQLLDDGGHAISVFWVCARSIQNSQLTRGKNTPQGVQEQTAILDGPEVHIKSVNRIHILIFVARIEGWQVPLGDVLI